MGCSDAIFLSSSISLPSISLLVDPASDVYLAMLSFALVTVVKILLRISTIRASTACICCANLALIFVISPCTLAATDSSSLLDFSISCCNSSRCGFCCWRSLAPRATKSVSLNVPSTTPFFVYAATSLSNCASCVCAISMFDLLRDWASFNRLFCCCISVLACSRSAGILEFSASICGLMASCASAIRSRSRLISVSILPLVSPAFNRCISCCHRLILASMRAIFWSTTCACASCSLPILDC